MVPASPSMCIRRGVGILLSNSERLHRGVERGDCPVDVEIRYLPPGSGWSAWGRDRAGRGVPHVVRASVRGCGRLPGAAGALLHRLTSAPRRVDRRGTHRIHVPADCAPVAASADRCSRGRSRRDCADPAFYSVVGYREADTGVAAVLERYRQAPAQPTPPTTSPDPARDGQRPSEQPQQPSATPEKTSTERLIPGTRKPNRDLIVTPDEPDDDDLYFRDRRQRGWLE